MTLHWYNRWYTIRLGSIIYWPFISMTTYAINVPNATKYIFNMLMMSSLSCQTIFNVVNAVAAVEKCSGPPLYPRRHGDTPRPSHEGGLPAGTVAGLAVCLLPLRDDCWQTPQGLESGQALHALHSDTWGLAQFMSSWHAILDTDKCMHASMF